MNAQTAWGQDTLYNTAQAQLSAELAYLGPMTQDEALMRHEAAKKALDAAKKLEMDLRVATVKILVGSKPKEGMNTVPLGNGYEAKAKIAYTYSLGKAAEVEQALDSFARVSNEGSFIADRLVTWTPSLSLTEYRALCEEAKTSKPHAEMLRKFSEVLTIKEAAPTLEIKAPKVQS